MPISSSLRSTLSGVSIKLTQDRSGTRSNRVPLTEEEPWHSRGVHKLPVKNYLVYFWVDEETKKVQVFGIIYGRRDQRHQLSNLDMN